MTNNLTPEQQRRLAECCGAKERLKDKWFWDHALWNGSVWPDTSEWDAALKGIPKPPLEVVLYKHCKATAYGHADLFVHLGEEPEEIYVKAARALLEMSE